MAATSRFELTPLEIASGFVFGEDDGAPPLRRPHETARAAFDAAVRAALLRSPCGIAFSGGRDSSAVLAAAVSIARREGLPLPVPMTLRFPGSEESDETSWQEGLIRELGLQDWVRREIHDELDCVGPVAAPVLRRHGLFWPPNAHVFAVFVDGLQGGSLLTGNGGDIAFDVAIWAMRPLAVLARNERPRPRDILRFGLAASPARVRAAVLRRRQPGPLPSPWLRPVATRALVQVWHKEAARQPMQLHRRLVWGWRSRPMRIGITAFDAYGADADVQFVHPFYTPRFVAAFEREARHFRYADRTRAMHLLFSDVLPHALRARPTKAVFNDVFWNRHSRAFAEEWEGEGADPELVDVPALQRLWRSDDARNHFRSCTQLQAAWLARDTLKGLAPDRGEELIGRVAD